MHQAQATALIRCPSVHYIIIKLCTSVGRTPDASGDQGLHHKPTSI